MWKQAGSNNDPCFTLLSTPPLNQASCGCHREWMGHDLGSCLSTVSKIEFFVLEDIFYKWIFAHPFITSAQYAFNRKNTVINMTSAIFIKWQQRNTSKYKFLWKHWICVTKIYLQMFVDQLNNTFIRFRQSVGINWSHFKLLHVIATRERFIQDFSLKFTLLLSNVKTV